MGKESIVSLLSNKFRLSDELSTIKPIFEYLVINLNSSSSVILLNAKMTELIIFLMG